MDSLLDALQEGRLIELPNNDKFEAIKFLAHIIEAIPSVPNDCDVVGLVMEREKNTNTALGKGFACPHARVQYDGDLICSVGWSPTGIDYGAPDKIPVHIIIMYLIPDNQRNHYLKEISLLARALQKNNNLDVLRTAKDLNIVRNYLLDLVTSSKDLIGFESRARMIQLAVRSAHPEQQIDQLSNVIIEPVTIVAEINQKPIVLTQNQELVDILDNTNQIIESLTAKGYFEINGWRIIKKSSENYKANRSLYDCIAVKILMNKE
jgi:mannitol/fructose-specific phosphotransferase system IIA component (Ntr-type)/uncharacterized coiled-coil protein SlyX